MRSWDGHCPECGSDSAELLLVKKDRLVKKCSECGHKWNEPREVELLTPMGWVNNAAMGEAR